MNITSVGRRASCGTRLVFGQFAGGAPAAPGDWEYLIMKNIAMMTTPNQTTHAMSVKTPWRRPYPWPDSGLILGRESIDDNSHVRLKMADFRPAPKLNAHSPAQ